jgi:hypothetical protein
MRWKNRKINIETRRVYHSETACHPCAGAMLIFSVIVPIFSYGIPEGSKYYYPSRDIINTGFSFVQDAGCRFREAQAGQIHTNRNKRFTCR